MDDNIMYNSRLIRALYYAGDAHKNQLRKGSDMPYLVHPVEVAMILYENNMPEDLIVAGLLHDVLEDTGKSKNDIQIEFGNKVLDLVIGASEELDGREKRDWKTRKTHTIQYLASASLDVKCVSCADKLSNIRSMLRDFDEIDMNLWKRFNETNPLEQVWYYNELVKSLSDLEEYGMYIEFKNSVDILAGKIRGSKLNQYLTSTLKLDNSNISKRNDIKKWLAKGIEKGASRCLIIYDRWDYEDYPMYVMNEEELKQVKFSFEQSNLRTMGPVETIMEIYDLRNDLYEQLYNKI